ncbi:MAG: hypothetical protein WD749_01295 [Phycisphaerales bacterium]
MKVLSLIACVGLAAASASGQNINGSGLVVLHQTASGALSMTGNSAVHIPTRAAYVNSSSSTAVATQGSAYLDVPNLYIVGNASFSGNSECSGTVHRAAAPYSDPLWGMAMPSSNGMTDKGSINKSGGAHTLQPGYYSGGMQIGSNAVITMSPGVYLLGASSQLNACTIYGAGVTIVQLNGQFRMAAQCSITLSPPSSGATKDVSICQPSYNTNEMHLAGGSNVNISGAVYVPGSTLNLVGHSSVQGDGPQMGDLVIALKVSLAGTGSIKIGSPEMAGIEIPKLPLAD